MRASVGRRWRSKAFRTAPNTTVTSVRFTFLRSVNVASLALASIAEVAALMRRHHVGDVVVVDNQQDGARVPIGIVTDRDILVETLALDVDPKMFSAAELMSSPVTTVQEDANLNEALGVMRGKKIRRLPVVNRAGGLFGMITSDDVINLIASELAMVAGLIVEQPIRESRLRK